MGCLRAIVLGWLWVVNVMLAFLRCSLSAVDVLGFRLLCFIMSCPAVCKLRWLPVRVPSTWFLEELRGGSFAWLISSCCDEIRYCFSFSVLSEVAVFLLILFEPWALKPVAPPAEVEPPFPDDETPLDM